MVNSTRRALIEWRDDYIWAATVLSSRSFPSRLLGGEPNSQSVGSTSIPVSTELSSEKAKVVSGDPILVPILDMLNHRPNHPVTWLTSQNSITFIAETSYAPNTEVFNNYGAKGNEECTSRIIRY
jgi:hypothetical protein